MPKDKSGMTIAGTGNPLSEAGVKPGGSLAASAKHVTPRR